MKVEILDEHEDVNITWKWTNAVVLDEEYSNSPMISYSTGHLKRKRGLQKEEIGSDEQKGPKDNQRHPKRPWLASLLTPLR